LGSLAQGAADHLVVALSVLTGALAGMTNAGAGYLTRRAMAALRGAQVNAVSATWYGGTAHHGSDHDDPIRRTMPRGSIEGAGMEFRFRPHFCTESAVQLEGAAKCRWELSDYSTRKISAVAFKTMLTTPFIFLIQRASWQNIVPARAITSCSRCGRVELADRWLT
jgi:hypothetical protein